MVLSTRKWSNEVTRIGKKRKNGWLKACLIEYSFLKVQDLWQAYYQILLIILLKEFTIKCKYGNGNKKCENCRSKYEDCECFIVYVNFKMI